MDFPILDIQDLTHQFETGEGGIFNISFSVEPGEFILLAGPNGSGKTTLTRHLNALLTPTSGRILLHGKDIKKDPVAARKCVGMVFQDADTQIVGDTVWDEVAFGPENLRMAPDLIRRKVETALDRMGLSQMALRNPATLSGGEKRRLAIAGILAMDPEVIVFDEPFANLDYPSSQDLIQTICRLNRSGHTILLATHEVEDVICHARRMLIMDKGCLRRDGRPRDLIPLLEPHGIKPPCFSRLGFTEPPWQV